jgi:hypothetical protein
MGPAKPKVRPIVQSEYDYLTEMGVINGTPGTLSDAAVRVGISQALNGDYSPDERYELLDKLTFAVHNNHARGAAADVLDEVSKAIDRVLGLR